MRILRVNVEVWQQEPEAVLDVLSWCGAGRGSNKHKEYLRKAYKTCFVAKDRCRLVDSDDNVRQVRLAAGGHGNCRRQFVEMP